MALGMAAIPVVTVTVVAALTLQSDSAPAKVYVKRPRGTLYWGGAGLNGPYIRPQLEAFQRAGIQHVSVGLTNTATIHLKKIGSLVDAFRAGWTIRREDDANWYLTTGMNNNSPQFNLIGYSYGSLLAAQTANFYSKQGHIVDHLVLIGSPIDLDFLQKLRSTKNIKAVVIVDLIKHGDPIYAGMTQIELLSSVTTLNKQEERKRGEGHFYYSHVTPKSAERWKELAERLVKAGLK